MTLFADHSDLTDLTDVAIANVFRQNTSRFGLVQDYWATPERSATDATADVLEITFTDDYRINWMQFDLAQFPHTMRAEYWNDDSGTWQPLIEIGNSSVTRTILASVPATLPSPRSVVGRQNPQHSFLGHWQTEQIALTPISVARLRLVLTREPAATAPVDVFGNYVDYSLAVRNFSIGYQVASLDDVPSTLPEETGADNGSYSQSFASTDDVLGSTVDFSLRTLNASRVLLDNAEDAVWRCELQPDPTCVVNFYADLRVPSTAAVSDTTPPVGPGDPQVIDRIFLDPINNGAHLSLYFATDPASGTFPSSPNPLGSDQVDVTNGVSVDTTGMHFAGDDSLLLSNDTFDYRPDQPWWVGMVATPSFNQTNEPTEPTTTYAVLFDCGAWQLAWTDTGLLLQLVTGDLIDMQFTYQGGLQTTIFVSYDGSNYQLWASNAVDTESVSVIASSPLDPNSCSVFALGSDLSRDAFGDSDINSLVIKEEQPPLDGTGYATDPGAYVDIEEYVTDEPQTSRYNAILRFNPSATAFSSNAYPWCIFGGDHSRYDNMVWTPVARDFTTQRGWIKLPSIQARFWKFEFTHLQPEYSDIAVPTSQLVRHFPNSVLAAYRQQVAQASSPTNVADDTHASVADYANYTDTPTTVSTGGTGLGFTNTEAYVADDLQAADRLYNRFGENWNYQQFTASLSAPRFTATGVHTYQTELVTRTSKIAYSIGLRNLKFARSQGSATYDTPQYEDDFFDTVNVNNARTSWVYDIDQFALTSGLSSQAQIYSRIMQSNRDVRGLQFAAQQSPPSQVLVDANFDDPHHQRWTEVGDARLLDGVASAAFDQLIPVVRSLPKGFWEDLAPRFGTWGAIESAGATWADLMTSTTVTPNDTDGNGIASEQVTLPQGGFIYAAARVVVDRDLFAPLWLQIVDSVTGIVLNEESISVRKGQIAEWYTTYEVNSALQQQGVTWADLAGDRTFPQFLDQFGRADQTGLGTLDSGQDWQPGLSWNGTEQTELDIVSSHAKVTTAGARSVIDVGTPWGKLTVQLGTMVTPGTPVELINLGAPIVRSDGAVMDPNTGFVYYTLTLAGSDTFTFDFMPTSQVPVGQLTSGVDASILSWSMIIKRNGTFVTTVSTAQPFSSTRGLAGAVGQTFAEFAWAPVDIVVPLETLIYESPVPRDGGLDSTGATWVQDDGRTWSSTGLFNPVDNGIVQAIQAPSGLSFDFDTDTDDLYGAMTFKVTQSTTTTDQTSYYVATLDDGPLSHLYLRADGALVQVTPALGTVVLKSNAVPSFSGMTTILFARTSELSSAFVSTYSLSNSFNQTLVFLNGSTVVGTYQDNDLFINTTRGVMGTDGSMISGFTWAPDLGAVNLGSGARTWDNVAGTVSGQPTRTWADVNRSTAPLSNPVVARVVQKLASNDVWYMDALPIYVDPIVWEFSNDGGITWTQASSIRNNPNAAVQFDVSGPVSNQLCYRVTAYAPNTWLSHLVIRPWYIGFTRDMPVLPDAPDGPNLNPLDLYVPVHEDANFMAWSQPIPREFFFAFRSILPGAVAGRTREPYITERIMAG